jgi:PAS domain S-box-containing protein
MNAGSAGAGPAIIRAKTALVRPFFLIQSYGLALFSVAVALCVALFLQNLHCRATEVPLLLFAVALTAWYGGIGPALVALVIACASFDYYFTEPLYTFDISLRDIPYFIAFSAFAALLTWFSVIRRRVENELRQARDRLEIEVAERTQQASLLDLTHDTIFVRDMTDVITYWNRGAQELYGWTADEAIGQRADHLLRPFFPVSTEEISRDLLRFGRWDGELKRTKSDGTQVVVASRWSLRRDGQGRPAAILETNNDVTERERREREIRQLNEELGKRTTALEASNKELEAFAYSISHDLRAPLRHMAGYAELLQKSAGADLNQKGQRYLRMILESAQRMGALIDDLLAFSRIGRAETHKTVVNLEQLVGEALNEVRQDTGERNILWRVGPLPSSYGDRSMLRVALINMIANAAKFTRTRSRAEVEIGSLDASENEVVVFIRDNGVGFDMKYVGKLFGVFQRLHRSEDFEGTGIGLATVQRIAHRHGGRAWAEGEVGKGATFYFSLSNQQKV